MDTFYMDLNCNKVTALTLLTTDTQVKSSQSTNVDPKSNLDHSGPDEVSTDTLQEPVPPTGAEICAPTDKKEQDGTPYVDVKEVQTEVSCEEILSSNRLNTSSQLTEDFMKIPLCYPQPHCPWTPLYIPKGTVITYADDEEPEMGLFWDSWKHMKRLRKQCSTGIIYPSVPYCQYLPKSDVICSPSWSKISPVSRIEGSWCNRRD